MSEREYLAEKFEYIIPKIDCYCPDLAGDMQAGDLVVYVWKLLEEAGIEEPLDSFTGIVLDLVGSFEL